MDTSDTQQDIRKGRFLREQVYKKLKASVLNGSLSPNKRLIEERVAGEMGTSRTPVREAIQKLEKEGLIHKLPRGGFAVSVVSEEEIEEVWGIRSVLEGYAACLATQRATEEEMMALEETVKKHEEWLKKKDADEFVKLHTEFHDLLYKAAKSSRLYNMINDLRDYIYRYRLIIFRYEGMAEIAIEDHKAMIALMRAGNARKVEKLVRKHIIRGKDIVKRKMKQESRRRVRKG